MWNLKKFVASTVALTIANAATFAPYSYGQTTDPKPISYLTNENSNGLNTNGPATTISFIPDLTTNNPMNAAPAQVTTTVLEGTADEIRKLFGDEVLKPLDPKGERRVLTADSPEAAILTVEATHPAGAPRVDEIFVPTFALLKDNFDNSPVEDITLRALEIFEYENLKKATESQRLGLTMWARDYQPPADEVLAKLGTSTTEISDRIVKASQVVRKNILKSRAIVNRSLKRMKNSVKNDKFTAIFSMINLKNGTYKWFSVTNTHDVGFGLNVSYHGFLNLALDLDRNLFSRVANAVGKKIPSRIRPSLLKDRPLLAQIFKSHPAESREFWGKVADNFISSISVNTLLSVVAVQLADFTDIKSSQAGGWATLGITLGLAAMSSLRGLPWGELGYRADKDGDLTEQEKTSLRILNRVRSSLTALLVTTPALLSWDVTAYVVSFASAAVGLVALKNYPRYIDLVTHYSPAVISELMREIHVYGAGINIRYGLEMSSAGYLWDFYSQQVALIFQKAGSVVQQKPLCILTLNSTLNSKE